MKREKYEPLLFSKDALRFGFSSRGPKGEISIVVQFIETNDPGIYNLAFGNLLPDGSIDEHVKNDNQDSHKILATIATTVYAFTAQYPDKLVYFAGSTPVRTRLYRMALTNNLDEISADFELQGVHLLQNAFWAEPFEKGKGYYGFVAKRKEGQIS